MNFISRHRRAMSVVLSVIILALIIFKLRSDDSLSAKIAETWTLIRSGSPVLIALVILLSPCNWLTESFKWKFLLYRIQEISILKALGSVLSGMSFAMISPGKVGDFAGRLLFLDSSVRWRAFFMSIIGSFSHFVVTCCMGVTGLIFLCIYYRDQVYILLLSAAILITAAGLFAFLRINKLRAGRRRQQASGWMRKVLISIEIVRRYSRRDLIRVLAITLFKFIIYNSQFVIITSMLGADTGFLTTFLASCVMFWLIMIIPSFFMADVIIRGMIAAFIFQRTGLSDDILPYISASYIIWLINWVIPATAGGLIFFIRNVLQTNKSV